MIGHTHEPDFDMASEDDRDYISDAIVDLPPDAARMLWVFLGCAIGEIPDARAVEPRLA